MLIGIDLGTTYSCVAYVDEHGEPQVIANSDGVGITPSVIWFDGRSSFVGKKANDRKITPTSPIYEFVKRDMGKPQEESFRYTINGYYYGAMGLSALILRKLKKEAFLFFRKKGLIPADAEEKSTVIPAVITIPAYFSELQRQDTRDAGYAAGLKVVGIINEPTAAALAYGRTLQENKKIMVFDLGGGTFDVSILNIRQGMGEVKTSEGADQLGGKDWDELIIGYLYSEYRRKTGKDIPDEMGWEVQQRALEAKFALTEEEQTTVLLSVEGEDVEITLYRSAPEGARSDDFDMDDFGMDRKEPVPFYFEERSNSLLSLCRTICNRALDKLGIQWGDIDEIILAGGSCRMPMIPKMLEEMIGRKIQKDIPGFSYDTAIAIGAALYGSRKVVVQDVLNKSIGVEIMEQIGNRPPESVIKCLLRKDKPLPQRIEERFEARPNATLKVYEGESRQPDLCNLRGRLELGNPEGFVHVTMTVNEDGILHSVVEFQPNVRKELQIQTDEKDVNLEELRARISAIDIRL